jgi:hypothetical protein
MRDPRTTRRLPRLLAILLSAGLLLAAVGRPAHAWGFRGHRASAMLAWSRLSPAAKSAVRDLLGPGESLADVSTWADEKRREFPESGPWHYVNVPLIEDRYDPKYCPAGGCVVSKVRDFRKVLADRDAPRPKRVEALKFLVHFVQDLHQPLHVGERGDRGGNDLQVCWFDEGSNLHRVWDSGLIERVYEDEETLTRALTTLAGEDSAREWAGKTVEVWADESLEAAKSAYRFPGSDSELRPGARLGAAYESAHLPVARKRLAQSGVRLAVVLNGVFGGNDD